MSFAEIGRLQGTKKGDVINKMSEEDYSRYERYLDISRQVANQRKEANFAYEKEANQRYFVQAAILI